jgi:hypothetical protein
MLAPAGAEVGVPLAGVGYVVSGVGAAFEFSDAYLKNDNRTMGKIAGFKILDRFTASFSSKIKGFDGIGNQVLQQNVGLKVWMLEKWYDKSYKPVNSK